MGDWSEIEDHFEDLRQGPVEEDPPESMICQREKHRKQAEKNVLAVRGSWDAPGFDACVEAEIDELMAAQGGGEVMKYEHREEYLLVCLMEECGELIQACSKVLRHGFRNYHPNTPPEERAYSTNWHDVLKEASDVRTIMKMLCIGNLNSPANFDPEKEKRVEAMIEAAAKDGGE